MTHTGMNGRYLIAVFQKSKENGQELHCGYYSPEANSHTNWRRIWGMHSTNPNSRYLSLDQVKRGKNSFYGWRKRNYFGDYFFRIIKITCEEVKV